ncbi:hypothetical protein LUX29_01120 [Aureimonas altamirensis]|uniref:hypothetical protein n=1 Tax=Aureimonas altamirensis TaxID=370622 RepID=UPI001E3FC0CA|nr:hypothetical protein [Aureimonas altamirensis]UHD45889.1 hypothetical protein LUX29_01120 [Aureimonas altamirensis]
MAQTETPRPRERLESTDTDTGAHQYSAWLEGEKVCAARTPFSEPPQSNLASFGSKLMFAIIGAVVIALSFMLFEPIWHMVGPVEALGEG